MLQGLRKLAGGALAFGFLALAGNAQAGESAGESKGGQEMTQSSDAVFVHSVFFELKDDDPDAVAALLQGCRDYLAPHEGIVFFAVMPRAGDKQREVNDLDFDVALTIAFESMAAHDAYQTTEAHKAFIEALSDNWQSVRVFDSRMDG